MALPEAWFFLIALFYLAMIAYIMTPPGAVPSSFPHS